MSTQMRADTRGLLCLPSKPAWLDLASASHRACMSSLAAWGELKQTPNRQGGIFKPSTAWAWLHGCLMKLACAQLAWRAREFTSVCIHPYRHVLVCLFSSLLNIFLFGHPLLEVFSWQLLGIAVFRFTVSLYCTKPNYCGVHNNQQKSEIETYYYSSINQQQINYICKMVLFLIIAGVIYNAGFISYGGVCNDLLFCQILLKIAHSSVLTSIKYSTRVKSTRHGSIHGMDAVTGKQTIPISSVLMFSQVLHKHTHETQLKQSQHLLWSVFDTGHRFVQHEPSHHEGLLWPWNNRICTKCTEEKTFHRNTSNSKFAGT